MDEIPLGTCPCSPVPVFPCSPVPLFPCSLAIAADRIWLSAGPSTLLLSPHPVVHGALHCQGVRTAALAGPGHVTLGFGAFCTAPRTPDLPGSPPGSQSKSRPSLRNKEMRGSAVILISLHAGGAQIGRCCIMERFGSPGSDLRNPCAAAAGRVLLQRWCEMIVFACHKLNSPIRELRLDFFH